MSDEAIKASAEPSRIFAAMMAHRKMLEVIPDLEPVFSRSQGGRAELWARVEVSAPQGRFTTASWVEPPTVTSLMVHTAFVVASAML